MISENAWEEGINTESCGPNDPPFYRAQGRQRETWGTRRPVVSLIRKQKKIKNEKERGSTEDPRLKSKLGLRLALAEQPSNENSIEIVDSTVLS